MRVVATILAAALVAGMAPGAMAAAPAKASQAPAAGTPLAPEVERDLAEKLGQCFVMKSTGQDRLDLAGWFTAALASAPQIAGVVKVDPAAKDKLDARVAAIFTRLMTVDCAEHARPLFKARSSAGFRSAGEALGRMATQELMGNPQTAQAMMGGYLSHLREEDFAVLAR